MKPLDRLSDYLGTVERRLRWLALTRGVAASAAAAAGPREQPGRPDLFWKLFAVFFFAAGFFALKRILPTLADSRETNVPDQRGFCSRRSIASRSGKRVHSTCDAVAVMYAGRLIEIGPVKDVIQRPAHPYTQGLMTSIPDLFTDHARLNQIDGAMPRLQAIPKGCAFHPRCPFAEEKCRAVVPPLAPFAGREVACVRLGTI